MARQKGEQQGSTPEPNPTGPAPARAEPQKQEERKVGKPLPPPDPFYRDKVFPDPLAVFSFLPEPLDKIKDTCLVVIDTNALLLPYKVGKETLYDLSIVYNQLAHENRLFIPAQVAREFAAWRFPKLTEALRDWHNVRSTLPSLKSIGEFRLVQNLEPYQRAQKLREKIRGLVNEYSEAIGELQGHITGWYLNDPVSSLYRDLFTAEIIKDPSFDTLKVQQEYDYRHANKIPPGYEDKERIGDYLIWKTILALGNEHKKPLIFVTGETKPDWVHFRDSDNVQLFPRYELVDEYRRESGNCTFHLLSLSRLLELYTPSASGIDEIRMEEKTESGRFGIGFRLPDNMMKRAMRVLRKHGFRATTRHPFVDCELIATKEGDNPYRIAIVNAEAGGANLALHLLAKRMKRFKDSTYPSIGVICTNPVTWQELQGVFTNTKQTIDWDYLFVIAPDEDEEMVFFRGKFI